LALEILDLVSEAKESLAAGGSSFAFSAPFDLKDHLEDLTTQLIEKSDQLIETTRQEGELNLKEKTQVNNLLQTLLIAAVVSNGLLAFTLAWFFNEGTIKSWKILLDNAQRLGRNLPLNPKLTGGDPELAQLDHRFHEMASDLKELERLKEEFLAMVSHDLRTPLASIQALLELIESGSYGTLSERGHKLATVALGSTSQMVRLLNDLLDMQKLEAGMMTIACEDFAASSLIEESAHTVEGFAAAQGVKIETEETAVQMWGDRHRLMQVLVNLLGNAVKFSPSGGSVKVGVSATEKWTEVSVRDQGRGIPLDLQSTVFERFKQVERSDSVEHKGSGLGLAICKAIVEIHKGQIGVDSTPGQGSRFWFRLPLPGQDLTGLSKEGGTVV
jgi:signal transduction histidine kinase